jgi:salicylate hydroxylase
VTASRTILIAGAGIGGLALALCLARRGFHSQLLEQAERLEEIGAGIQLSPNATRILLDLGLQAGLERVVVAPEAIRVMRGRTGTELARAALGREAEFRYGAPYWVVHRGDLQAVLVEAVRSNPGIDLRLGTKVEHFAEGADGVTVRLRAPSAAVEEHGIALVGADGIWSSVREQLGGLPAPQFRNRSAWRALVPADAVAPEQRHPVTTLWLGPDAHLVHYPVRAGKMLNIVAVVEDTWRSPGWDAPAGSGEIAARFSGWAREARSLIAAAQDAWSKWALYDSPPVRRWGRGRVVLLGDAAHPTLPFLAQGGAMAIEDASVLAAALARTPDDPASAFRIYQRLRQPRIARVVREARRNGWIYHLAGPAALARDLALRTMGGEGLLASHDWLYDWRPQSG